VRRLDGRQVYTQGGVNKTGSVVDVEASMTLGTASVILLERPCGLCLPVLGASDELPDVVVTHDWWKYLW